MENIYTFRLVTKDDLPLLASWLEDPRVKQWFTDEDYVEDLEESLDDSRIRMQLVSCSGKSLAYVQDYDIAGWDEHHLGYLPAGSRGIDTFIGQSAWMGKGHGVNYLSQLCTNMFKDGVPALGIDPDSANTSAIKTYEKIGFARDGECETKWGKLIIMSLSSQS